MHTLIGATRCFFHGGKIFSMHTYLRLQSIDDILTKANGPATNLLCWASFVLGTLAYSLNPLLHYKMLYGICIDYFVSKGHQSYISFPLYYHIGLILTVHCAASADSTNVYVEGLPLWH